MCENLAGFYCTIDRQHTVGEAALVSTITSCTVTLRYSFELHVTGDIPWGNCVESYGTKL